MIKAKVYSNNITKAKFIIKNPMTTPYEAKVKKESLNYINHIKLKANGKLVFNIKTSYFISKNPLFKFNYKDLNTSTLKLQYTDNNNLTYKNITIKKDMLTYTNKKSSLLKNVEPLSNLKTHANSIKAIKNIFGDIILIEGGIRIKAPKIAENGNSVPVNIRSNIRFKSIVLFIQPSDAYSYENNLLIDPITYTDNKVFFICQWFNTPYSIANFHIRIKMQLGESNLIAVLEAENGKFYVIKQKVISSIGGGAV